MRISTTYTQAEKVGNLKKKMILQFVNVFRIKFKYLVIWSA
jgi:hypothetical protein